ncbi:MAG TPA: YicC/YloC family endoribonuclease [Xanthobacteraceae bacterium]|nr:YicC/YloC family endoribonuclease [Xanthobacteraceae bacterium]
MALSSMTGFARADGAHGAYFWIWELKSVNAKGLEVRLRLPPGWDAVEMPVRARAAEALARGTVYANLAVRREGVAPVVRVNEPVLDAVLSTMRNVAQRLDARPASLDGILALKGVIEVLDEDEREEDRRAGEAAVVAGFGAALAGLNDMRRHEGLALGRVLEARLAEIAALAARAEAAPGRKPEAIRARLADQVAALLDQSDRFDADRLHQEAILIAARVDVREELDRLAAHVAQARRLIAQGGAVGRRLDFLSQELNREANTLCSKSNDVELTNIGLELKSVVEQFREQVQNLE